MNQRCLDVEELLTSALEERMGVPQFMKIRAWVKEDIFTRRPKDFRKMFNRFFVVRRNEKWQDVFYALYDEFEKDMLSALTKMWDRLEAAGETPRIELSFLSKMMSTYCNDRPVWDANVIRAVRRLGGPKLKVLEIGSKENRIRSAALEYNKLFVWCQSFLASLDGARALRTFNERCPHQCMCDLKKLDCLLWYYGGLK